MAYINGKQILNVDYIGGASGTWEKLVDITTTEEVNGIYATNEEYPNISKCKEFIVRVVFPQISGNTALALGKINLILNEQTTAFYSANISVSYAQQTETRCHLIVASHLIYAIGTENNRGVGSISGNAIIMVGNRIIYPDNTITSLSYLLQDTTKLLPIGTQFIIYGKVEG